MESIRPYFPNDTLDVPVINYPRFTEAEVCNWNVKIMPTGDCMNDDVSALEIYMKAEWNAVQFLKERETIEDGYGGKDTSQIRVDPVYSFTTWADEYILWYFYQVIYKSATVQVILDDASYIDGVEVDVEHEEVHKGVYKVTVSYQTKEAYHTAFGLTGCCRPLYEDAPFETCETNETEIDNNVPPCDDVTFSVSEATGTLTGNIAGAPGATNIAWYYRPSITSAWTLLISGASSVSLGAYGIYRAILTATGCGQYIDQFLYTDPCTQFDVRLRQTADFGIIAELTTGYDGATFVWEFNDGTGWDTLADTTAAITAAETGDYRVTATYEDCEDQDIIRVVVSDCSMTAELSRTDDSVSVLHSDCDSPTYVWYKDTGSGLAVISGATSATIVISETGTYKVIVSCDGCTVEAQKFYMVSDGCDFSVAIDRTGNTLTADTDADTPTYVWELETDAGRVEVGTSATQAITERGIYFLQVTSGACTKETYVYVAPSASVVTCVLSKSTGYEFVVYEIDLLGVVDPAAELTVIVGTTLYTYTASTPGSTGLYSIKADGKLITFAGSPLTNAIIKIRYEAL